MTEALFLVSNAYPHHRKLSNKGGTAGVTLPHVEVKVVNVKDRNIVCKANEKGQIVVRTTSIMKGYFKNKSKTEEVLKDGWYFTGDYGWVDEDNYLFVVDRTDELIHGKGDKIIVPSSLEAIIRSHDMVEECMVIGKKEDDGSVPIAFVIRGGGVSAEEIQELVKSQASEDQWLSGGVRFVESLPKSPAGKLLRKDLNQLI